MDNRKRNTHRTVIALYYGLLLAVIVSILYCIKLLILPLLISLICALILDPLVNYCEALGFKRIKVIIGIYAAIVLLLLAAGIFIAPRAINEGQTIARSIPRYRSTLLNGVYNIELTLQKKFPTIDIPDFVPIIKKRLPTKRSFDVEAWIQYLSSFFAILSVVIIIPFVTFFLLAEGHMLQRMLLELVPNSYFEMVLLIFHKTLASLKQYLRGQLIDASAVTVMTAVGLTIIGLPYAILISLVAGMGSLIPYLGPIIGFTPALLVVAMGAKGLTLASILPVVVVFVVVNLIEGNIVYPLAVGRSVDMHPLLIILAITIGGQLWGIVGMLIVVPVISIVKVTFQIMYTYLKSYSII